MIKVFYNNIYDKTTSAISGNLYWVDECIYYDDKYHNITLYLDVEKQFVVSVVSKDNIDEDPNSQINVKHTFVEIDTGLDCIISYIAFTMVILIIELMIILRCITTTRPINNCILVIIISIIALMLFINLSDKVDYSFKIYKCGSPNCIGDIKRSYMIISTFDNVILYIEYHNIIKYIVYAIYHNVSYGGLIKMFH